MDKKTLDQANSLMSTMKTLDDLNFVMNVPYPQFSCGDKNVNSAAFDEETLEQLKTTIGDFIEKRKNELKEEFKSL